MKSSPLLAFLLLLVGVVSLVFAHSKSKTGSEPHSDAGLTKLIGNITHITTTICEKKGIKVDEGALVRVRVRVTLWFIITFLIML
jgi:hypothetical protein